MNTDPILIAGATSGIGKELAAKLTADGNSVISASRTATAQPSNSRIQAFDVDFTDSAAALPEIDGPIGGLVYCPGSINLRPFHNLKIEDFEADLRLNLIGAIRILQAYHKNLKASENPSVVLLSTVATGRGMPFHASIAAAKGAIEGLGRSLAAEWAPHIRVNVVAPALTDTPLAAKLLRSEKLRETAAQRHPLKRIGTPENLASSIAFLLSPNASWITGQVLHVDGGMSTLLTS